MKCPDGYHGIDCTNPCSPPSYGSGCVKTCNCSPCHPIYGCVITINYKGKKKDLVEEKRCCISFYWSIFAYEIMFITLTALSLQSVVLITVLQLNLHSKAYYLASRILSANMRLHGYGYLVS